MTQQDLEATSRKGRIVALADRLKAQAQAPEKDLAAMAREALVAGQALAASRAQTLRDQTAATTGTPVCFLAEARARAAAARHAEAMGQARYDTANRPVSGVSRQTPPAFIDTMKTLLRPD